MSILLIDNYDSFVYNLYQALPPSWDVVVKRNDAITLAEVDRLDPTAVIVSPGPGHPSEAGISLDIFAERSYPTLGVCLGHQALCHTHGSPVEHTRAVIHGKTSTITHDGHGIFSGVVDPFPVARYHSLGVSPEAIAPPLVATAWIEANPEQLVMAVRHEERPHVGVQFHPESFLTEAGEAILENFLTNVV